MSMPRRSVPAAQRWRDSVCKLALLAGFACTSAVVAAPAFAQGATPTKSQGGIPTIHVTAEFRSENLQNTPIAITAINSQMLEARSQTNVVDVAAQAPNVTLQKSEGAFGNAITASIRGVGQGDMDPALEPGVGIYVDDVYYSQLTGSVLDLLDVDRVEVLRGPQGTLAGQNSIGGAIRIFSKKPTGDNSATVQATYGDYNRIEGRASGDFSVVPDKLFMRVAVASKTQTGYVTKKDFGCANPTLTYTDLSAVTHVNVPNPIPNRASSSNCTVGHEGGDSFTAGRVMLRWLATDKIEVNIIGDYTNQDQEGPAVTLIEAHNLNPNVALNGVPEDTTLVPALLPKDPYVSYADFRIPAASDGGLGGLTAQDRQMLQSWGLSASIDWQILDNLSVKSVTSYRRYTSAWSEDNDASPMPNGLGIETMYHYQTSQEIRINGSFFDNAVEYTLGGFYFDQNTRYATHQDLVYVFPGFDFLGNDPVVATNTAGFVHGVWHITNALEVEGGIRYTDTSKDYTFRRRTRDYNVLSPFLGSLDGLTGRFRGSRTDYRAAINYRWNPNLMTYFQFSTGFKGGGVDPRPFYPQQVLPFGPETLDAYEAGFKSQFLQNKGRFNFAAFWNNYNKIQVTVNDCTVQAGAGFGFPCALPVNAADADVWGVEGELEFHPIMGLEFDAAASYLHFKYSKITAQAAASGIASDMITPNTPTVKWSAGVQYEFDLGSYGSFTPRLDADYHSSFFGNAVNYDVLSVDPYSGKVNGRTLLNLRATWQSPDKTLSAALEVTNLTDDFYYVNKFSLLRLAGWVAGQPGAPRQWAFTIKKKF
jgi:iron complex outermembrane receptor protein